MRRPERGARGFVVSLIAVAALALTACGGGDDPPPGGSCPAPPPKPGPIDIGGITGGMAGGGSGSATLPVPGLGDTTVSLTCESVTVNQNKPKAGQTTVVMKCSFSKFLVISGNLTITIVMGPDGKGTITVSGSASVPIQGDVPINVTIDLTGGTQSGNTITVGVSVNGECGTATITRDPGPPPKITIQVDKPPATITVTGNES